MSTVRCSSRLLRGCLPGGCLSRGVCRGGVCLGVYTSPLWTEFLTHACENIAFPQLRLRTVTIVTVYTQQLYVFSVSLKCATQLVDIIAIH